MRRRIFRCASKVSVRVARINDDIPAKECDDLIGRDPHDVVRLIRFREQLIRVEEDLRAKCLARGLTGVLLHAVGQRTGDER